MITEWYLGVASTMPSSCVIDSLLYRTGHCSAGSSPFSPLSTWRAWTLAALVKCVNKFPFFFALLSFLGLPRDKRKRGKRAEIKPFSSRQELAKHTPAFYSSKSPVTPWCWCPGCNIWKSRGSVWPRSFRAVSCQCSHAWRCCRCWFCRSIAPWLAMKQNNPERQTASW